MFDPPLKTYIFNNHYVTSFFETQVRASFFEEIVAKVGLNNENITLDNEMGESHQLCEDMFIFSKVDRSKGRALCIAYV